jgi:homoserine kinase
MRESTFSVPATTANLGPGFDCLGVALDLSNRVTVAETGGPWEPADDIWGQAAARFFETSGVAPFAHAWRIEGGVPRSRGLGSSVTVRLGLVAGLNDLAGDPLGRDALFELCAGLEGHPDNAAPAAYGGFTVAGPAGVRPARFEVDPALRFVLLIPGFEVATPDARRVLPETLPRRDAVRSAANACRVVAAFASRDYGMLRGAFGDGLHQPYRRALIPFLDDVIRAGEAAGAFGGFLSGSGSTICCVAAAGTETAVAEAMRAAAPGAEAAVAAVGPDNAGARRVRG